MLQQGGGGNVTDYSRPSQHPGADGKGPTINKKELPVWKLPDQVTKHEFRHWLDLIDTYLAAAQHFEYPEVVLDKERRHESEVN